MLSALKNFIFRLIQQIFVWRSVDVTHSLPEGPVLVIAPHPDDETLGCGATIARLCAEGRKVRVVIVTDGRSSTKSAIISPDQLAEIRREEAIAAVKVLGVSGNEVFFLNCCDGKAAQFVEKIAEGIEKHIELYKPGFVFVSCGLDEHIDHRACASAVGLLQSKQVITGAVYQYPLWNRIMGWPYGALKCMVDFSIIGKGRYVKTEKYLSIKRSACSQHRSQVMNITGEKQWTHLPENMLNRFHIAQELFFETSTRKNV